jgi:hypothetical protein
MKTDAEIVALLDNTHLSCSRRYGETRAYIEAHTAYGQERKRWLERVGHFLGGELQPGHPPFWKFPDGSIARVFGRQPTAIEEAFKRASHHSTAYHPG